MGMFTFIKLCMNVHHIFSQILKLNQSIGISNYYDNKLLPSKLSRPVRGITVNQSLGPNAGKKALINNKKANMAKNKTSRKLGYIKRQHSACIPSVLITETNKFTSAI